MSDPESLVDGESIFLPAGTVLYRQGSEGDCAYLLERGKIVITQMIEGQRAELDSIRPGEIFGEMAVIDGAARMATAVAAIDSVVTPVSEARFTRALGESDRVIQALVGMFIRNIRGSNHSFVRRPRSFRDNIKLIRYFSVNIRRYAALIEDKQVGHEMQEVLDRIDAEIAELAARGGRVRDKRHDHIVIEGEETGVNLVTVMGTEGRRQL